MRGFEFEVTQADIDTANRKREEAEFYFDNVRLCPVATAANREFDDVDAIADN